MANKVDYVPKADVKFTSWQNNLVNYIVAHKGNWHVSDDAFDGLLPLREAWQQAYAAAINPGTRTVATIHTKKSVKNAFIAEIRKTVKAYITYNPVVTSADREHMALPIHDGKPTPILAPEERPLMGINFSEHEQHLITVRSLMGHAKPDKTHGFELWSKIGDPAPVTEADFHYAGFNTKSKMLVKYNLSDVGKNVYYRARWVNAKNEPGPWGQMSKAVIA
jgi:hypothetical protein